MNRFIILLCYLLFVNSNSFIPIIKSKYRKTIIYKSHFTTIETKLDDKDMLIRCLREIYPNITIRDEKWINGYNNEKVFADIVIKQENNIDFGFVLNNNHYEMVSDLQFWQQPIPPDVFLEKLYQKYSLYKVIDGVQEQGFNTDLIDYNSENGCIELQVSRYNV